MDVQLVQTFLEVNRTRHFARAAEGLCVTQAAVSARIAQLEHLVGAPLFIRQRNNIQLTAAGEKMLPQAEALITAWNRLLIHSLGVRSDREAIALGCLPSIGEIFFEDALVGLCNDFPELFLQLELLNSAELLPRIRSRSIDIGLLYEPVVGPNMHSVKLVEVPLVLVSAVPFLEGEMQGVELVQMSWGSSFDAQENSMVEKLMSPLIRVDSTRLARNILLSRPSVARLPLQQVGADISSGDLYLLDFAEPINRELFLVCHEALTDKSVFREILLKFQQLLS